MDDQVKQIPRLTPEEELDVLESVWKIGEEKGLQLLQANQVKKLVDNGRIPYQKNIGENLDQPQKINQNDGNKPVLLSSNKGVQFLVAGLRAKVTRELVGQMAPEGWGGFTEMQKQYAISCYFTYVYGATEQEMVEMMTERMNNGN